MKKELFLKLAFCKAFEMEFGTDEYLTMENLEYDNEYLCLEDVLSDDEICKKIDKCAREILKSINNLEVESL